MKLAFTHVPAQRPSADFVAKLSLYNSVRSEDHLHNGLDSRKWTSLTQQNSCCNCQILNCKPVIVILTTIIMKTLTRYVMAAAGLVTFLVAVKVLIMIPPEEVDLNSQRHNKDKAGLLLWGRDSLDGHDELQNFGHNNPKLSGEMGRGVVLPPGEKVRGEEALLKYGVNVLASDLISLNRQVPDSRPVGCESVQYPDNLPGTAIVIIFHNEWPSVLLRTVYSLINRTPKHLLQQIILVDDASDLKSLKDDLDHFIREHFPTNLVKLVHIPERVGLIRARLEGFRHVTAEVVSFFDSHMEVNVDWLQPLLVEIVKDRRTVAMGHLDYIQPDTFEYSFTPGYRTRYGFDWRLVFFETFFLKSQDKDKDVTDPLPGVVMVGPGFAINSDYFREIGMYDEGMEIWGGENLELAWRVWLCGGRLVHLACSKLGHIARPQPYTFPDGRYDTEIHNYKRAIEVWMGPYKKLVYEHHPKMKEIDAGDLTERKALRDRLQCKSFTWYLKNIWPELYPYGDNATHWGATKNQKENLCLDNNEYLFLGPEKLTVKDCNYEPETQSFALTLDHKLRSVLQCVGVQEEGVDMVPILITCHDEPFHTWTYTNGMKNHSTWTYTPLLQLKHDQTGLCLQLMQGPRLVMQSCRRGEESQVWRFEHQGSPTSLANEAKDTLGPRLLGVGQQQQQKKNTKSPKEMLNDFEKQLFLSKDQAANARMMQGPAVQQGGLPVHGSPLMQRGGPLMQGDGQLMQRGGPLMQEAGPPMQGVGPPMQGNGQLMQGVGPLMHGNGPLMQGNGPLMQEGGPLMQRNGPLMHGGGPLMQGNGPLMQGGGPLMHGNGPLMQGRTDRKGAASRVQNRQIAEMVPVMQRGAPKMQGGVAMPQRSGAGMPRGRVSLQGGGVPFNQQEPQLSRRNLPPANNRAILDGPFMNLPMKAADYHQRALGGGGGANVKANALGGGQAVGSIHSANNEAAMEEFINRKLYAEARNTGKLR